MRISPTTKGTLCLFLTAVIWGLAFVAQRVGADYLGPFTFNGARFALGGLSLIPLIFIFERKSVYNGAQKRRAYTLGLGGGFILFAASSLQQFGVQITGSAGKSGFITGLYTVLVPIIGVFLGKKTSLLTWLGAVLAVAGLYFLSVLGGNSGTGAAAGFGPGDVLLIIGAVFWAFHILFVDFSTAGGIAPLRFSATQFLVCSALSMASALVFEDVRLPGVLNAYVPLLYGGLASVGVAYTLQIFGQRYVEPARAAIIFSLETLFAAVGGALLLGERMRPPGYLGCALIFAGIIASQVSGMGRRGKAGERNGIV
ncbi:MAG: DMT family transporter [Firmicutes bacterium]|nr:DMT family transporter [Bacillota bacterium]